MSLKKLDKPIFSNKICFAVKLDHGPGISLDIHPDQPLGRVSTLQFLGLAPALSLGLFLQKVVILNSTNYVK
jgi:hypothetical protein